MGYRRRWRPCRVLNNFTNKRRVVSFGDGNISHYTVQYFSFLSHHLHHHSRLGFFCWRMAGFVQHTHKRFRRSGGRYLWVFHYIMGTVSP